MSVRIAILGASGTVGSTLALHILRAPEKKYRFDFDRGLSPEQRATAWAFEKMAEDNLYWSLVHARWASDANFYKGPAQFFRKVPAPLRPPPSAARLPCTS